MLSFQNIARGTTDPEIDSVNWIKFGNNVSLIANMATRWRDFNSLQIRPPDGTTCISYIFGHKPQVAQLGLVQHLGGVSYEQGPRQLQTNELFLKHPVSV